MSWLRLRWLPLTVLATAVALLAGTVAWAVASTGDRSPGVVTGPRTVMGPGMWRAGVAGDGPVRDLGAARRAAQRFADRWGLTVGEVMQFDNGFYAELAEPSGALATEVLVDPGTGGTQIEFGPAMMWNTAYGMHRGRASATPAITPERAQALADRWLAANRPGEHAGDAELFPGYYTLHTMHGDQITGMLSVHAVTGAVWYHYWHGRYLAMSD